MKTRIITAIVGIAVLAAVLAVFDTVIFDLVVAAIALLGMHEAFMALGFGKKEWPIFAAVCPITLIVILSNTSAARMMVLPAAAITMMFYAACLIRHSQELDFARLSSFLVFSTIIGFSFYSFTYLKYRLPSAEYHADAIYFIVLSLCYAWGGDTFAYFAGRAFGKHKLAPVVSPKKTVEGAIGGILGCVMLGLVSTFVYQHLANNLDAFTKTIGSAYYVIIALLGVVAAILGMMGDLFASVIKRQHGIKDYGTIFPGHGGILDRFDSVIFVIPFVSMTVRYLFYFME